MFAFYKKYITFATELKYRSDLNFSFPCTFSQ